MRAHPPSGPGPHPAYQRLASRPGPPPTLGRPAPCPSIPPTANDAEDGVCERCHAWASCCFCAADVEGMRAALRRIAELHSACDADRCPERARLAAVPRRHRPAR